MSYGYAFPTALPGDRLGVDVSDLGQDFAPSSDGADDYIWAFSVPFFCEVKRLLVYVTETVVGTSNGPVLKFWKNGTGGTLLDTITIPAATAAGKCMYVDISEVQLQPGDEILVELDAVATGGSPAGMGWCMVEVDYYPETLGNLDNMVESA